MQATYDDSDVPKCDGATFGIVAGEWHREHTQHMIDEATALLQKKGAGKIELVWAPGSFEIPILCRALSPRCAAIMAFGVVLRGDTRHFEMIADGVTQGLMSLMLQTGVPIMNEVIAAENIDQVIVRTKPGPQNKGREAAIAALKTVAALRQLQL